MGIQARLSYAKTNNFSKRTTVILCALYLSAFCGLLVFNFLTQAKALQCLNYPSSTYDSNKCEAAPLSFAGTYYTTPVAFTQMRRQAGTFPWSPLGFGEGADKGPIDYSILTTNWTGQPLGCVMYEQVLTLHLDSGGWTVASCYYCGGALRLLCTTVDSERTQLAGDPASTRVDLGAAFTRLRNQIQAVATTAYDGGIVLSARMITKRYIQSTIVDSGTLPYNASSSSVILGTTIGSSVVFANDTNSALANIAVNGNALGVLAEQATSEDIQPSGRPRTLQASYTCKKCEKRYKPTLEIFAVVGAAIFAILTPAFAAARIIAELIAPNKERMPDPEPSIQDLNYKSVTSPYSPYSGPPMIGNNVSAGTGHLPQNYNQYT